MLYWKYNQTINPMPFLLSILLESTKASTTENLLYYALASLVGLVFTIAGIVLRQILKENTDKNLQRAQQSFNEKMLEKQGEISKKLEKTKNSLDEIKQIYLHKSHKLYDKRIESYNILSKHLRIVQGEVSTLTKIVENVSEKLSNPEKDKVIDNFISSIEGLYNAYLDHNIFVENHLQTAITLFYDNALNHIKVIKLEYEGGLAHNSHGVVDAYSSLSPHSKKRISELIGQINESTRDYLHEIEKGFRKSIDPEGKLEDSDF